MPKLWNRPIRALREDLECLLEPVDTPTEIHERLVKARVHILDHFRFEELGGYLDAIRLRHPRLDRAIQHLLEEHGQLMQTLESLIAQAAGSTCQDPTLTDKVRMWIRRLHEHESRENRLVGEAYNVDIGTED